MPLDVIALSYTGVLVGVLAAMLVVTLCVAANRAVNLIEPFLWELNASLLQDYQ